MEYPFEGLFSRLPGYRSPPADRPDYKILCPFHNEDTPSCYINLSTGRWYCYGLCSRGGGPGDIEEFLGEERSTTKASVAEEFLPKRDLIIPEETVLAYHTALISNEHQLNELRRTCGFTNETVERFKIGWTGQRYTFPVYDEYGNCRNIRLYLYGGSNDSKVLHYYAGRGIEKVTYGSTRLFPLQAITSSVEDWVLLCEGEKDALTANQLGIPAVSITGGAGSFDRKYCVDPLREKVVFILYDIDDKGKLGAKKIYYALRKQCRGVAIINLPSEGLPPNGDLTDWVFAGADKDDILALIQDARHKLGGTDAPELVATLAEASIPTYHNKLIEVDAHVVGRETTVYTAERGYHLHCPVSRGTKICGKCPLSAKAGSLEFTVPADSKDLLYTIEKSDAQVKAWIEGQIGLVKCTLWDRDVISEQNSMVEKIILSTTIDQKNWDGPSEFVQQVAYVVDSRLESNQAYTLNGRMTTHPKDQSNTFIVNRARTTKMAIDTFDATGEMHERLKFFQPKDWTVSSIWDRLQARVEDLSTNVTKIYKRPRLHMAVDLVAHSLLRFEAFGDMLQRGWTEGYIGGDTRQGKSDVAQKLHAHYRAGELIVAETATLSGLLGGAQKLGNGEWMVSWGKAPLNDRGWLTIDECQNISLHTMGSLSGMRSYGIAEIDKIKMEKVFARTRLLWLSNPRKDNLDIDQLAQGIMLVTDVFGRPEDVARLDFATMVRSRDIDISVLRDVPEIPHSHTTELCHELIMFAWSRQPHQIVLNEDTEQEALKSTEYLSAKYDRSIRLVEPIEQRKKMIRIAGAIAALTYCSDTGDALKILPVHVQVAQKLLEYFYDDDACGYDSYSESAHRLESIRDRAMLRDWLGKQPEEVLYGLLNAVDVKKADLENYGGVDRGVAQGMYTYLLQQRALIPNGEGYVKNRAFVTLLKECIKEGHYLAYSNGVIHKASEKPVATGDSNASRF